MQCGRPGFDSWVGMIPWRREWLPTPVFWPGEFHGPYSPWDCKELDRTERLSLLLSKHEHFIYYLYIAHTYIFTVQKTTCKILGKFVLVYEKYHGYFDRDHIKYVDFFEYYGHFNINSSNPGA